MVQLYPQHFDFIIHKSHATPANRACTFVPVFAIAAFAASGPNTVPSICTISTPVRPMKLNKCRKYR